MDQISILVFFVDLAGAISRQNVFGLQLCHADTQLEISKN